MGESAVTDTEGVERMTTSGALAERLVEQLAGALEVLSIHVGLSLGLYEDLAERGPARPGDLAERTGIHPRYAREWLEQQAAAGLLDADGADGMDRVFTLPEEHRAVLVEQDHPDYAAAVGPALAGVGRAVPAVLRAFRSGRGVPFADYGEEIRRGIGGFNRPMYVNDLEAVWMPALGEHHRRLQTTEDVRILDLGCGTGSSTVALARAFPGARVDGIDLDESSVADARSLAKESHVQERVTFRTGDAATVGGEGYDLVCLFEVVHDAADPAGVLRAARRALRAGGVVLVADENVADEFTAPADLIDRLNYGFSVLHCLPATMAEDPVEAIGTVMRPAVLERLAREAGFTRIEELAIDNDLWRFVALTG